MAAEGSGEPAGDLAGERAANRHQGLPEVQAGQEAQAVQAVRAAAAGAEAAQAGAQAIVVEASSCSFQFPIKLQSQDARKARTTHAGKTESSRPRTCRR